jgi:hypothetical protein
MKNLTLDEILGLHDDVSFLSLVAGLIIRITLLVLFFLLGVSLLFNNIIFLGITTIIFVIFFAFFVFFKFWYYLWNIVEKIVLYIFYKNRTRNFFKIFRKSNNAI